MMYPDGWPLNQHNIVLSAKVIFQGQHSVSSGPSKIWGFKGLAYTRRRHDISKFCKTLVVFFWVTGFWLMLAYTTAGRIPWKIYILHHVMLGLKTRIIAQVLAYALTAIEREPELGTIISTTYTPWAVICLKKYNLERLTSMFSLKDD